MKKSSYSHWINIELFFFSYVICSTIRCFFFLIFIAKLKSFFLKEMLSPSIKVAFKKWSFKLWSIYWELQIPLYDYLSRMLLMLVLKGDLFVAWFCLTIYIFTRNVVSDNNVNWRHDCCQSTCRIKSTWKISV